MRTIKKYTLSLITATSFLFVGCSNTESDTTISADSIMEKVDEAYNHISSIHTNMSFELKNNEQNESAHITLDMQTLDNPKKAMITITMDSAQTEVPTSLSLYMDEDYLYMNLFDNWVKQPLTDEMKQSLNLQRATDLVNPRKLDNISFSKKDDTTIDGADVYVVSASLRSSILQTVLNQSFSLLPSNDDSLDLDFSKLSDVTFDYYINKENYAPIKLSSDFSNLFSAEGESISGTLDITFDNINSLSDISLPDDAKNASDLSSTESN